MRPLQLKPAKYSQVNRDKKGQQKSPLPPKQLALEDLPLRIDQDWLVDFIHSDTGELHCFIKSQPQTLNDGQGETTFQVILDAAKIRFKTTSNIDLSYPNTGVVIRGDITRRIALDGIEKKTTAIIDKNIPAILALLRQAQHLDVYLGFWPTWPLTDTKRISITLNNFPRAQASWAACNRLITGE
jgi:hypothetical protein